MKILLRNLTTGELTSYEDYNFEIYSCDDRLVLREDLADFIDQHIDYIKEAAE